jgi:tRNA(His) 5'-end guanylyltransferase
LTPLLNPSTLAPTAPRAPSRCARGDGKNELLFQHGINFNDLPTWQRRGVGLYWQEYRIAGYDPQQQRAV